MLCHSGLWIMLMRAGCPPLWGWEKKRMLQIYKDTFRNEKVTAIYPYTV